MANKTLNNVKINMTLKSTTTRAKLLTSSEDLAVQLGKINKWYDSLVPTGGASGNILGWNSDGTAKWVTVAPSANKLNISSAVGGTSQPVYFKSDGTPETISFTIEKSVPSNAVFTDEKVKSSLLTQSTAAATYKPTFVSGAATGGVYIINSYQVAHTPGTTSAVGNTRLVLGNSTASGTANNEEGQIKLYSPGTALHTIKGTTISSEAVHVLPSTGGTILNTGTTSYTQTVASSATGAYEIGKIKINGTTTTLYGKDTGTSYTASNGIKIESGVIKHTNSITEETSTVFKKFSYDAQGHITDVAKVAKSDITALGIPASDTKYGISGAYGSNNNTWVTTITAGGSGTTSTVPTASTSAYGITKLYNGVDSTSTGLAATANAVKTAYDKANHSHPYLPLAGGTLTGRVTTAKFLNYIVKGTGTAGADKGSGQNPRYVPAKWTFDTGQTVSDGDIIFIKIPVAGHDYGVYISIDNGASYHPAVISGSSRLTTHYGTGNYAAFTYRSDGSAASMIPLAGNTDGSRVTVTGGVWQGIDYYDSGNTYDRTSMQTRIYAGGVGVFRYSICALNNAQRMESFTTTGDASGSPTTTKTFNTSAKFAYPPVIMYNNANAAYSNGSVIGNNVLYEQFPSVDMRYSCNKTSSSSSGFSQYKPIFIECTFDTNGYFSITSNGFVQTFTNGKYYILVGCMYNTSVYQLALFAQHPLYYYDGTNLRYMPTPHTHDEYLPISGGTMTGGLTFGTSTSIVSGSAINIYTRATSTYSAAVKWSNGDTMGTRGAEIGYHNTGGDSTNPGTICILPYQTDSNPWDGEVGLFIKKDHVYIDGVELSKSDSHVTQTATTTNADYEVLFSATADNTTRTETARKNSNLKFNPSTGMLNAGRLTLASSTWGGLIINRTASSSHAGIIFQQNGTGLGSISMGEVNSPLVRWENGASAGYKVYDEGNVQPMLWRYVPSGDPATATDAGVYPAYTMAYMQGTGAFGGSTGRLGNSGTTYWAHYLTFTHNSSFRYILRFPFWGPPQFQHTNNDTDQKWSNFITDEHVGNYSRCMGTGTAIDPITGAMTHMHRANKLAFPPAANITVQISNDSGSTWSNLSVTDTLKRQIFSLPGRSSGVKIGPTSGNATTSMQTRIIFECDGRDVVLNRFLFGIGSDYHTIAIDVYAGSTLSGLTKIATGDASGTWAYEAVATIDNIPSKFYRFSTSNYKFFAFVFRYVTVDSSHLTNRGSVNSIAGYSGIFWGSNGKSNLANYDHMYSWDVDQNVDFPADVAGNSLSAPTVNVSTSSYKASVTASGLTQNRAITIGDVSGDVGIVKVLHDNDNYAAGQTVAITTAEKFKYFIVTVRPNNTFGEKTEIIRITQDTSISTKYISFTGNIGPAPSQPTITLGGYITHQYNTTSKTYTIGVGHAANYILCNNNVSSVRADSITLTITKIVGLA